MLLVHLRIANHRIAFQDCQKKLIDAELFRKCAESFRRRKLFFNRAVEDIYSLLVKRLLMNL